MFRRTTLLAGALASAVVLVAPLSAAGPADAASSLLTGGPRSASLVVPCGTGISPGSTTADWYVPAAVTPKAVIWVQHGFSRSRARVRDLATRLALGTDSIVVAPNAGPCGGINATAFHQGIARLFGDQQARLQSSYAAAFATVSGAPAVLPEAYVLTGHSAGGNAVTAAAGFTNDTHAADRANLKGVVLYDPVENKGAITTALRKPALAGVAVATISAPDASCNASSSGTKALRANRTGFIGFRLANGTHNDAEGPNGDVVARLVCGSPRSANVEGLRLLAVGWINDMLAGTFGTGPAGTYAPTGAPVTLISGATATSL